MDRLSFVRQTDTQDLHQAKMLEPVCACPQDGESHYAKASDIMGKAPHAAQKLVARQLMGSGGDSQFTPRTTTRHDTKRQDKALRIPLLKSIRVSTAYFHGTCPHTKIASIPRDTPHQKNPSHAENLPAPQQGVAHCRVGKNMVVTRGKVQN